MNLPSHGVVHIESDFDVLWQDGERVFFRERRTNVDGDPQDVLIVTFTAEHPAQANLERLAHEFSLRGELEGAWALRPLELLHRYGRTMLALEDTDGVPLDRRFDLPIEFGNFLRLAISITAALVELHRRGLVHKDLKPTNILVSPTVQEIRFTGFGIAARPSGGRQLVEPLEIIAGTPAYMAPEQFGRLNRSIDCRSDLYALGVIFYQLLTGALPFQASDPVEWMHCHIAKQPIPLAERRNDVPGVVSAIVMKLLAKKTEERYQTAAGLRSDLQRSLAAWNANAQIERFELGESDKSDRLVIPERLYGRQRQLIALLASFDRVAGSGAPELALISGYSGVGKSALVQELHRALTPTGRLLASGKFDQYKRDVPYASVAEAFQGLIRRLLTRAEAELSPWRDALREALGPLGQLMVDLIPELRLIIGDQPAVGDVSPQNAQRRFQLVFHRFIGVFARPDHPLALFFDDLQWLDTATLDLIEYLLTQSRLQHLLLIGAYRENEVGIDHPLRQRLDAIRNAGARVLEISLAPLTSTEVNALMADTIQCEPPYTAPLAQLMHEKTGGNPFFLIQFLYALAEEGLLKFDHDKAQWSWDLGRIRSKGYTENVADLMIGKLSSLPEEMQTTLVALACLGSGSEATTLSLVQEISEEQVHANLQEAVRLKLIHCVDRSYHFAHDRVQEAAYGLRPPEDRCLLHLDIGMALAAHLADATSDQIYLVANLLNRGTPVVRRKTERETIVAVNLSAGRRARSAAAYDTALVYLEAAREMLGDDPHPSWSPTAFSIALLRAECEFLVGHPAAAEAMLLKLSQNCPDLQASAAVARLRANIYTAQIRLTSAVDVCLGFLRQVGIDWSPHPTEPQVDLERRRLRDLVEGLTDEQLHALPSLKAPEHRVTIAVLADLITPATMVDHRLSNMTRLAASRLTLEHGICDESCYALVCVPGAIGTAPADARLAHRLERLGIALAERQPDSEFSGRSFLVLGALTTPWTRPIRSGRPFMQRSLKTLSAAGDLADAAYARRGLIASGLYCGDSLAEVLRDAEQARAFCESSHIDTVFENITVQIDLARRLMGQHSENAFAASRKIERLPDESTQPVNRFFHFAAQMQVHVLAGRHDIAMALAEHADAVAWSARIYPEIVDYRFYKGLAHADACNNSSPEARKTHLDELHKQHDKLTAWSTRIPDNFVARKTLLASEIARIDGRELEAAKLYEKAVHLAREVGFVQIEAIAAERAARFYETQGISTVGSSYRAIARSCYRRWGADAKVRQFDELYPRPLAMEPVLYPTSTIGTSVEHLDLATMLKVSEAVLGEIILERLVGTVLRTALEHAGAERGLLILPKGSELRIQATAFTTGASVTISLEDLAILGADLPESLVLYTARTLENVILEDASASDAFGNDEYIRRKRARSVLCIPVTKQGKLVALLYLENNLTDRVFTPARVAVLRFLTSQAATSLDNARLYRAVQEREARISRLVDLNIVGIFTFGSENEIVDANNSFLKIVGYDREDLAAGRLRWTKLAAPECRELNSRKQEELLIVGSVQPFEEECIRKDGSRVPVLIGLAAFNEERDQPERGVAFVLDLSERKRAQDEAIDSERRFREAQMELAHANRVAVMGQLTASIAHEVSQPTNAILTDAQAGLHWLTHQPPELDSARDALSHVVQNGMRAREVIERIRDLIKKKPARRDRLDINPIINEVVELTKTEATRNGVLVRTAFSDGLAEVAGDRVELQQVTVNLILNGLEAMSGVTDRPRELLIRTTSAASGDVLVAVIDSGPGLPLASPELLFKPFHSTKPDGLGIGLSICQSIIEAHGGRLWASPHEPHGAILQFTVPVWHEPGSSEELCVKGQHRNGSVSHDRA